MMLPCYACLFTFCVFASLAELEGLRAGQWMLSRPIVLGPLLGWLLGDAASGARFGAILEILCLEELPLGAVVPLNGTLAVAGALWLGRYNTAMGAALAGGLLLGWLFRPVETLARRATGVYARHEEAALAGSGASMPMRRLWAAAALHFMITFGFLYVALSLLDAGLPYVLKAPGAAGLETALMLMPLLGLAALLNALRPRA